MRAAWSGGAEASVEKCDEWCSLTTGWLVTYAKVSDGSDPSARGEGRTRPWDTPTCGSDCHPRQLTVTIQIFSLVCIFFEGNGQGVMGGVNAAPTCVVEVGMDEPDGTVTDTTHQGGIVSIYYLDRIFGCLAGGWGADRIGRINGLFIGSIFAVAGGALQAAIQSSDFIVVARVMTGIGTGALTRIRPVLVTETATADHRGGFVGYVFIANCISVVYLLSFRLSINSGYSNIHWRFLLANQ
ncbi:hypothetical protein BDW66DRAFT_154150 [Aspergillus desertorum]